MKLIVLLSIFMINISACTPHEEPIYTHPIDTPDTPDTPDNNEPIISNKMTITVNQTIFTAIITDNDATKELRKMLPMTVNMGDLNRNEKYLYLPKNLPTSSYTPPRIESGDILLFGSNCLVIFYKSLSNYYSYTRIGKIENATGLQKALGSDDATVKFELIKD